MTQKHALSLTIILAGMFLSATMAEVQPEKTCHITVQLTQPIDTDDRIHITGNIPSLGAWNGVGQVMTQVDSLTWTWDAVLDAPTFTYKLTLGDWSNEADVIGLLTSRDMTGYKIMDTLIQVRGFGPPTQRLNGKVTGYLQVHPSPETDSIPSRNMWVWQRDASVPTSAVDVLLMTDGQNCFDPKSAGFGTDWGVDEALDSLMRLNLIPATIVIGVACATDGALRQEEYGDGALGRANMNYFATDLIEWVKARYTINRVFLAGSSMGGCFAFQCMAWKPGMLSGAIAMSPAVHVETSNSLVIDALSRWEDAGSPWPDTPFYLDNGGIGLESDLQPGIDRLLKQLKISADSEKVRWVHDPQAQHNELAWRRRFPQAYLWLANTADQSTQGY